MAVLIILSFMAALYFTGSFLTTRIYGDETKLEVFGIYAVKGGFMIGFYVLFFLLVRFY